MGSVGGGNLGRNAMQCPLGSSLPQNRLNPSGMNSATGANVTGMKPDQLWAHPNRWVHFRAIQTLNLHLCVNSN